MKIDPKEFQEFLKKITPQIDMNEILEMYKKNLEYITSCNQVLMATLQDIYNLNVDFMKQQTKIAKDNAGTMMDIKNIGDYARVASDVISSYFKDYTNHINNIKNNIVNSSNKMSDIAKDRTAEVVNSAKDNMNKMHETMKKAASKW